MTETVSANDQTLCHKNSSGLVRSTLPDVCKAPTYPAPFTNVAYAAQLAKGTTTVKSHKGAMCGIKGSEFSTSIGDEPGVGGGVTSGTHKHKATWLSWSPNVFAEGKPVTRLSDRMLMNKGNTISAGGYYTGEVRNEDNRETMEAICEKACECLAEGTMNQRCVAAKMDEWAAENGQDLHPEASYVRDAEGDWGLRGTRPDGSLRTSRPAGSRVPDFTDRGTDSIIEVKLANPETSYHDRYGAGQEEDYREIAQEMDLTFEEVDFDDCDCDGGDGDGETEEETVPQDDTQPGVDFLPLFRIPLPRLPLYIPPNIFRPPGQFGPPMIA